MNKNYPFGEFQRLLGPAQNILIALPEKPLFDHVASSLSLFLTLGKTKKNVNIVCAVPMTVGFSHLVGLDKIAAKISGKNLVLTINAPIADIEKVSTQDDGQHLSVVIAPKEGAKPLTREQILFENGGSGFDLALVVGVKNLEALGKIYTENQETFNHKPMINIDNDLQNTNFGRLNIVDPAVSSCSEVVAAVIAGVGLPMEADIASNLFLGLKEATGNFQDPKVSADTFETAAWCLRVQGGQPPMPKNQAVKGEQTPPDWLEPKIYKGSTMI